jgi:hypothetical protein
MEKVNCTICGADNSTNSKFCSNCGYELSKIKPENLIEDVPKQQLVKKNKKKFNLGTLIGICMFFIFYYIAQQFVFKPYSIDKTMMSFANEFNKTCPIMIDAQTRIDNVIAIPGNIFQYNYTLLNLEKATADTLAIKNYLEKMIKNNIKTNPQMKYQREHNTTLNYYYKDKNGVYLFIISYTPDKYK